MGRRLRFCGFVAICVTMIGSSICLLVPSAALATRSPVLGLRHSLGQLVTALRETASPTACSSATPAGQAALIEIASNTVPTPPGTTCQDVFAGLGKKLIEEGGQRSRGLTVSIQEIVKTASLRVTGDRASVRLTRDSWVTGLNHSQVSGAAAVKLDPLGVSHWIRNREGRWMFNDRPTGSYSSAGISAAALISNALKGSTLRVVSPPLEVTFGFCSNQATTHDTVVTVASETTTTDFPAGQGGPWFVAGGYNINVGAQGEYPQAISVGQQEAPFDAQGDPQGSLWISPPPFAVEYAVKLVGNKVIAQESTNQGVVERTVTPGMAGC